MSKNQPFRDFVNVSPIFFCFVRRRENAHADRVAFPSLPRPALEIPSSFVPFLYLVLLDDATDLALRCLPTSQRKQDLGSFLVSPLGRLSKLGLVLRRLRQITPPDHEDYEQIPVVLDQIDTMLRSVRQ